MTGSSTSSSRSFKIPIGSEMRLFTHALNRNLNLPRFKFLYICGNYSSALNRLDRRFRDLAEIRHSLIIIEHDHLLYEDATAMIEYVSQGLHYAAKEAAVLLYSPSSVLFRRGAESYDEAYLKHIHGRKRVRPP